MSSKLFTVESALPNPAVMYIILLYFIAYLKLPLSYVLP